MTTKSRKITPNEAVGIIAAQSLGEPSTQMSLDYDEKVIVRQEDEINIVKIGEFVDSLMDKYGFTVEGDHEICDLPIEIYVPSLTEDEKIKWMKVTAVSRHSSPEKLIRITTRSGRTITATQFHSFVIRRNNKIIPIAGAELKEGDRIPVVKNLPLTQVCKVMDAKPILEKEIRFLTTKNGMLYAYPRENSRPIPQNIELDESFGWLIGIYLSEGSVTRNYVSISNTNEVILNKIREFAKNYNISFYENDNFRGFARGHDIYLCSTLIAQFLKATCGCGSEKKRVPNFAFSASDEFIRGILRGYFDGDGNINLRRRVIRVSSKSKELIDGIALLLSRLGIFTTKGYDGKSHWLSIQHHYAKTFLNTIGSDIYPRKAALEEMSKIETRKNIVDMIPGIGNILFEIAKQLKIPTRLVNNFTKRQKIGRSTLKRYISLFEFVASDKKIDISDKISILKKALESDVVWDEIIKIDYVEPKHQKVYDFTVPGSETFTTAEGIITHNTLRTFHYAGVAEAVPLGLPRIIEILDARKEPKFPVLDIYFHEKYSKDEKKVREIVKKIEELKLSEVASIVEDYLKKKVMIKLNEKAIEKEGLTLQEVKKKISNFSKDCKVKFSGEKVIISFPRKKYSEIRNFTTRLKDLKLKGVDGISKVVILKSGDEYFARARSSNLEGLAEIPEVDISRSYTNDIFKIYKMFGIEAARNSIVMQLKETMEFQDLAIDIRHLRLIADAMTWDGTIQPIGRHGLVGKKKSVLSKAAFEETIDHLIQASIKNEVDKLEGITENMIVGQVIPVGTGKILLKMKSE